MYFFAYLVRKIRNQNDEYCKHLKKCWLERGNLSISLISNQRKEVKSTDDKKTAWKF